MIIQLQNPIPIICPKGKGLAHFLIDYGPESHIQWVCFLDQNGECWTFQNPDIRAQKNITQGRDHISDIGQLEQERPHIIICPYCKEVSAHLKSKEE